MKRFLAAAMLALVTLAASAAPDGACQGAYPKGWQPTVGKVTMPYGNPPKPAKGTQVTDSAFDTCIVRVTDHSADGLATFGRNDYARRQAFNADNTRQLIYTYDGSWHLYDAKTYAHMGGLPGLAGDAEPQWHPTDPNRLRFLPYNGIGMQILERDLAAGTNTVIANLASRINARWPGATSAWTKSEGSPSADGRYWCLMAESYNSATYVVTTYGFFTYDLQTDTILAFRDTDAGYDINNVSMSPTGDYCVVNGYAPTNKGGVRAYDRALTGYRVLADVGEHSDIGLNVDGHDVMMSIDYQSSGGDVYMVDLHTGVRTALFPTYLSGTATAMHFSGKAFGRPGWFLVSTYADGTSWGTAGQQWLHRKLLLVQMKADPIIYNVAHTQNVFAGYWTEPHASISRNGEKIAFGSNWNTGSELDIDTYVVQIPAKQLSKSIR